MNVRLWSHAQAILGAMGYQAQPGMTPGSTARYTNNSNPAAAVPSNTAAALGTGLGGQFWETATAALDSDVILSSFQVPTFAGSQAIKRLVLTGVWLDSFIQTVIAGGPFNAQICLAFGHTAVSLATAEAPPAKAPRIIPLGFQLVTAAQAVNTSLASIVRKFDSPVVVNAGEFVALTSKHLGTVGTGGVIAHVIGFDGYFDNS